MQQCINGIMLLHLLVVSGLVYEYEFLNEIKILNTKSGLVKSNLSMHDIPDGWGSELVR